jgi:5,10-methylenetetrahydromethanopterin reductase
MRQIEAWTTLKAPGSSRDPRAIPLRAARLEADGWSGATIVDSQCLMGDPFTILALCVGATTKLKLGTGTSNPATRHPSVIASATATLQVASEGRMTLSIGRGDSALAYIGAPPVPLRYFERVIELIQAYLGGADVPLEDAAQMLGIPTGFDQLAVASAPEASRLEWLPDGFQKPELEVAASGPKVIAAAARHADCVSFALGADVKRLEWAIGVAREELERVGRDPATIRFGAYIPLFPHSDVDFARELAKGVVASHSRFSVMNKKVVGPVTDAQRDNLAKIAATYDMRKHGEAAGKQAQVLDHEFIDNFGLLGDPDRCVERIHELARMGIERFNFWTADTEGRPGESYAMAADRVLPEIVTSEM